MDKHYVGLKLTGFEDNGKQRPISRVTLKRDDENAVTAGDDTGVELIADCPHATQAMCDAILRQVGGYTYQAYTAEDTDLDPAAELGDGVTASGVYSVISRMDDDGSGYAGVSAPGDPEMEDEFPMEGPMTQEFKRRFGGLRSYINKTASEIRMGVADDLNDLEASFTLNLNGIRTQINDINGNVSRLEQTTTEISARITNEVEGLEASFRLSLDGIQTQINDTNKNISSVEQKADQINVSIRNEISNLETSFNLSLDGIRSSVRDVEGNVSTLEQTATSLSSRISGVDGRVTDISASLDSISLSVSNGEDSSQISLVKDGVSISSKTIRFTGKVVFESDLANGTTSIDGSCIDTGRIYVGGRNRGVGEIVIDYGSNEGIGSITSNRNGIILESVLNGITLGASTDILMECGGDVTINPSGDVTISPGGNFSLLARDIEITSQGYFTIDGSPAIWGPIIYLTSSRYYTFETDGIHYHSSAGESVTTMVPK